MSDRENAKRKLAPLREQLERRYDLSLDFNSTEDDLKRIYEHYKAKRQTILVKEGEAAALGNSTYAKSVLISETVRLYLREIAPKRPRTNKRK